MRTRTTRPDYKATLENLSEEELRKKACIKAMAILERSDRTESELRLKLKTAGFGEAFVEHAITYVKSFHYIDDLRYAQNYVRSHMNSMSRRELSNKLLVKGVDKELITLAFEQLDEEYHEYSSSNEEEALSAESAAAVMALKKKLNGKTAIDDATKKKVLAYMYRKGYRRDSIDEAFDYLGISIESDWFSD